MLEPLHEQAARAGAGVQALGSGPPSATLTQLHGPVHEQAARAGAAVQVLGSGASVGHAEVQPTRPWSPRSPPKGPQLSARGLQHTHSSRRLTALALPSAVSRPSRGPHDLPPVSSVQGLRCGTGFLPSLGPGAPAPLLEGLHGLPDLQHT